MGFGFGASDVYTATALALKVILTVFSLWDHEMSSSDSVHFGSSFGIATHDYEYPCH